MIETADLVSRLSNAACIGHIGDASKIAEAIIAQFCKTFRLSDTCFYAVIPGKTDNTLLIDAHIDEIGFCVTSVDESGILSVAPVGSVDPRILAGTPVEIHTHFGIQNGVFSSIPPHLCKEKDSPPAPDAALVDTMLQNNALNIVSVGDYITFASNCKTIGMDRITSKSLDNRAGCAALILAAERLSQLTPEQTVYFLFSDSEELGLRGAKTAVFELMPDSAVVIDVSFAAAPGIPESKCGKLGGGPMIGFSPVLNRKISEKLCDLAKQSGKPYQREAMGGTTSTNADVISLTKTGIPTGLISIPIRNMHTKCEIADLKDIEATARLLVSFVQQGGAAL